MTALQDEKQALSVKVADLQAQLDKAQSLLRDANEKLDSAEKANADKVIVFNIIS